MNGEDSLVRVGDALDQIANEVAKLVGQVVADRIGNIDGSRTFRDHRFNHATQKIGFRTTCIFGRELYIIGILARHTYRGYRGFNHLVG